MPSKLKVGFKFCGSCNPHIETRKMYKRLKSVAESIDWIKYVSKDSNELEVLIIISGCPVDCAERPNGDYLCIAIAGESIDRVHCNENNIPKKVIEVLSEIKEIS